MVLGADNPCVAHSSLLHSVNGPDEADGADDPDGLLLTTDGPRTGGPPGPPRHVGANGGNAIP